jgi:hypothetical protein
MDSGQTLSILWNIIMGLFIIYGYWNILYARIYVSPASGWGYFGPENDTNKWLWAGVFYNKFCFVIWCISAFLAFTSYWVLFIVVICIRTEFTTTESIWFLVSNSLFLFFSSLFSFLVFRVFKQVGIGADLFYSKFAVMVDLLCVAAAAICMVSILLGDQKDVYSEHAATGAAFYLAFHCFVVDFLFWGITWCIHPIDQKIYHVNPNSIIFSAAIDTDPSTMGIFTRLRIKHKDVQTV